MGWGHEQEPSLFSNSHPRYAPKLRPPHEVKPPGTRSSPPAEKPRRKTLVSFGPWTHDDMMPPRENVKEKTFPRGCLRRPARNSFSIHDKRVRRLTKPERQRFHCQKFQCKGCRTETEDWKNEVSGGDDSCGDTCDSCDCEGPGKDFHFAPVFDDCDDGEEGEPVRQMKTQTQRYHKQGEMSQTENLPYKSTVPKTNKLPNQAMASQTTNIPSQNTAPKASGIAPAEIPEPPKEIPHHSYAIQHRHIKPSKEAERVWKEMRDARLRENGHYMTSLVPYEPPTRRPGQPTSCELVLIIIICCVFFCALSVVVLHDLKSLLAWGGPGIEAGR